MIGRINIASLENRMENKEIVGNADFILGQCLA